MRILLFATFILLQSCSSSKIKIDHSGAILVPTINEVGATVMPENIAPVNAPFAMPGFKKPVFAALTINIQERGALQNVIVTKQIQAAIDEANSRGGGMVVVPAGKWKTGRLSLKSNVNLHISEGAELHFSGEIADYLPVVFTRNEGIEVMSLGALIYANGQNNIAITGKGKLIGARTGSVQDQVMDSDVIENVVAANLPVAERIYDGKNGSPVFLPMFISPINCTNVYIEGVTLLSTPFWNIVPVYCDGVIIRGITVNSVGIPRGDGIDIESSQNVLIEYCTLASGDDCFTIKAGRGEDGMRVNKPSQNIVIRYCIAREGHGGITCGSETAGMIRNLYVHDCVFDKTEVGIRFKTRRPRGGGGENLIYERLRMNLRGDAFKFDMLGSRTYVGDLANRLPMLPINRLTPKYSNITARNIVIEKARYFVDMQGIPETPVNNFLIENATVQCSNLFRAADATNVTIRNAVLNSTDSTINLLDVRNIAFEKVQFNNPSKKIFIKRSGELSEAVRLIKSTPTNVKEIE